MPLGQRLPACLAHREYSGLQGSWSASLLPAHLGKLVTLPVPVHGHSCLGCLLCPCLVVLVDIAQPSCQWCHLPV